MKTDILNFNPERPGDVVLLVRLNFKGSRIFPDNHRGSTLILLRLLRNAIAMDYPDVESYAIFPLDRAALFFRLGSEAAFKVALSIVAEELKQLSLIECANLQYFKPTPHRVCVSPEVPALEFPTAAEIEQEMKFLKSIGEK